MEKIGLCVNCQKKFLLKSPVQKYCYANCRRDALASRRQKYYHLKRDRGVCVYCQNEFEFQPNDSPKRKYCSKQCREKDWKETHVERCTELSRNAWEKKKRENPIICRECGEPIPIEQRAGGRIYCKICSEVVNKRNIKKSKELASKEFSEYKESLGCQICGYNKFGCSLDYHHKDPSEKERRVTLGMWKGKTSKVKKELKKCILVCKNCHAELHYWMKHDMDIYRRKVNGK